MKNFSSIRVNNLNERGIQEITPNMLLLVHTSTVMDIEVMEDNMDLYQMLSGQLAHQEEFLRA